MDPVEQGAQEISRLGEDFSNFLNSSVTAAVAKETSTKGAPPITTFLQIDPSWDSSWAQGGGSFDGRDNPINYRVIRLHISGHPNGPIAIFMAGQKFYEELQTTGEAHEVNCSFLWPQGGKVGAWDPLAPPSSAGPYDSSNDFRVYAEGYPA